MRVHNMRRLWYHFVHVFILCVQVSEVHLIIIVLYEKERKRAALEELDSIREDIAMYLASQADTMTVHTNQEYPIANNHARR